MQALIAFFLALCLLRRAPQDLPASPALFALTLLGQLLIGMLLVRVVGLPLGLGLVQELVDTAFMLLALYLGLALAGHPARLLQAGTALLGVGVVLGLIIAVPLGLLPEDETVPAPPLLALAVLGIIAWSVLVTGHIIRHAFELRLSQGAVIALAYFMTSYLLMAILFGEPS